MPLSWSWSARSRVALDIAVAAVAARFARSLLLGGVVLTILGFAGMLFG